MRNLSGIVLVVVAGALAMNAARGEDKKDGSGSASNKAAPYVHVVIFTIKKDAPEGTTDKVIADCQELLAKIPSVRDLKAGKPAEKSTEIAKKNYQVGLLVLFDDYDGLKAYLDHKLHLEFLDRNKKFFETSELGVYDFVNSQK